MGLLLLLLATLAAIAFLGLRRVEERAAARTLRSLSEAPSDVRIVVLGCPPRSASGEPNPFFVGRVASAAAAWHHANERRILCSGRIESDGTDEASALAEALESAGVPRTVIELDRRAARTIDTIEFLRARSPHERVLLVTQPFHLPRALQLARGRGLDAWGLAARGPRPGWRIRAREALARARAFLDLR